MKPPMSEPSRLREVYAVFAPLLWARRRMLATAYLFNIIGVLATLLLPWPLKVIIDEVLSRHKAPGWFDGMGWHLTLTSWIVLLACSYLLINLAEALAYAAEKVTTARLREKLNLKIRGRILSHIQRLSGSLRIQHRSGELVLRLVGDVGMFTRLLTKTLPTIFRQLATSIMTVAVMFAVEARLGILGLASFVGLLLLVTRYGSVLQDASRRKRTHEGDVAGLAQEIVRSLPFIQAMGRERLTRKQFKKTNSRSVKAGVQAARAGVNMERTLKIAKGAALAAITGGGALMVQQGHLTVGELTVFLAYMTQLFKPVEKLNDLADSASRGWASGEQLVRLMQLVPEVQEAPDALRIPRARGILEFRNVSFSYPEGGNSRAAVLNNVNLRIEPDRLVLLTGESGAGKSTLLSLMLRLYEPNSGEILLDGVPLRQIALQSLRSNISVNLQQPHLFSGTIREVFQIDGQYAPDEQIRAALARVHLDRFVRSLPQGLDTRLAEEGINLSGGQQKRLSLALSLVMDRPIVLLDEPLANVDSRSADVIVRALEQFRRGRTCLVITHSPRLLQHADVIYQLRQGEIRQVDMAAAVAGSVSA